MESRSEIQDQGNGDQQANPIQSVEVYSQIAPNRLPGRLRTDFQVESKFTNNDLSSIVAAQQPSDAHA